MKKFRTLCVLLLAMTGSLAAQEETNTESETLQVSPEIWAPKSKQADAPFSDNNPSNAKAPPPPNSNVVNAPIDGGVLVLLGAGVLYGRKRLRKNKAQQV
jgi:hypothetical protein